MALTASKALEMLGSLEEFLSAKAAEETMEGESTMPSPEGEAPPPSGGPPGGGGGLGVVIEMAPKGSKREGKVPGCPDCEAGTPHQHMGR